MGWKNWSYWLKGGIIGLLLFVIIAVSNITVLVNFLSSIQAGFGNMFLGTTPSFSELLRFAYLFSFIIAPIIWFVVGALMGWIYGKIKQRGKKNG